MTKEEILNYTKHRETPSLFEDNHFQIDVSHEIENWITWEHNHIPLDSTDIGPILFGIVIFALFTCIPFIALALK